MKKEQLLELAMLENYEVARKELRSRGGYFRKGIKNRGGLAFAKLLLAQKGIAKGLQVLVDAGRPDLTLEALVISAEFRDLFTKQEIDIAAKKLEVFDFSTINNHALYPDEIVERRDYREGAVARVLVNRYERDSHARDACLKKHGIRCKVCDLKFEDLYGETGKGFIHVHHVRPLGTIRKEYKLDPEKDLVPVCPNCHAMLHRQGKTLFVHELRNHLRKNPA